MTKEKEYKIDFWYCAYGTTKVKANSRDKAERKITKHLENSGLDELTYNITNRDYHIEETIEIKKGLEK